MKAILLALLSGVIGGSAVWVLQRGSFSIYPAELKYEDFAALLLSGAALLVTIVGVGAAVLAFWGYAEIKRVVDRAAQAAAVEKVDDELKTGELRSHIDIVVINFLDEGFRNGTLMALLEQRRKEAELMQTVDEAWAGVDGGGADEK